jgi:hypothetical protein
VNQTSGDYLPNGKAKTMHALEETRARPIMGASAEHDPATLFVAEVHAPDVVVKLDPLVRTGSVIRLVAPFTEPVTVNVDGAPAFTLTPTDRGQPAIEPTLALYEAILDSAGVKDNGETTDAFVAEAIAAMRAVLKDPPRAPLSLYREENLSRIRQAHSVGRSYGLTPNVIAEITGYVFTKGKLLVPPMRDAKRLADAARAAAKEAEKQAAAFAVAEAERTRARTVGELGLDGVVVRRNRLASASEAPWSTATPAWEDGGLFVVYAWPKLHGLALPLFEDDGVRSLRPEEHVPSGARPAKEVPHLAIAFIREVRSRHGKGLDMGAIPRSRFTLEHIDRARELLSTRGHWFLYGPLTTHLAWKAPFLMEALTRGLLLPVETSAELAITARDAAHAEQNPDIVFETDQSIAARKVEAMYPPDDEWQTGAGGATFKTEPRPKFDRHVPHPARLPAPDIMSDFLSTLAVKAAAGGNFVSAGELLESTKESK